LDEQPQAATRAAILAAAARAVDAQPQDAQSGATSLRHRRVRERASRIGPSRRPLALVASFLVATVALVLVTRTNEEREESARSAVASKAPEQMAANAPAAAVDGDLRAKSDVGGPSKMPAASEPLATDKLEAAPAEAKPAAPPAPSARMQRAVPQSAPPTSERQDSSRRERTVADAGEPGRDQERAASGASSVASNAAPAPASPPAVGAVVAAAPAAPAVTQQLKEERSKDMAMLRAAAPGAGERALAETDAAAPARLAKARPVERTAAMSEESVENDPVRWMERIIALRDAGHDEEADRELARLRERYPDVKVPETVLRRTGTR